MRFDPKRYPQPNAVTSPRVRWVHDYWTARATLGVPARSSIDPLEMPDVLSCLMLIDVVDDRFRYRLVGTEVAANAKHDFTGMYLDSLNFSNRDFYLHCYRDILESRQPIFGLDHWAYADGRNGIAEFGMMPLTHDGVTVSQILTIEDNSPPAA
jgi:hypothetical protein